MSRSTDYHTGAAKAWTTMAVKLTPEDRTLLVRLTHARGQTASDVVRDLLRQAANALTEEP